MLAKLNHLHQRIARRWRIAARVPQAILDCFGDIARKCLACREVLSRNRQSDRKDGLSQNTITREERSCHCAPRARRNAFQGEMAIHLVHPHIVRVRVRHDQPWQTLPDGIHRRSQLSSSCARNAVSSTAEKVEMLAKARAGGTSLRLGISIMTSIPEFPPIRRDQQVQADRLRHAGIPNFSPPSAGSNHTGGSVWPGCAVRRSTGASTSPAFGSWRSSCSPSTLPYDTSNNAAMMLQRINASHSTRRRRQTQLSEELCGVLRRS